MRFFSIINQGSICLETDHLLMLSCCSAVFRELKTLSFHKVLAKKRIITLSWVLIIGKLFALWPQLHSKKNKTIISFAGQIWECLHRLLCLCSLRLQIEPQISLMLNDMSFEFAPNWFHELILHGYSIGNLWSLGLGSGLIWDAWMKTLQRRYLRH